jgi:transposase
MASIIKKMVKGRAYYYIAESKRVDGKPRMVKQWYLGSVEKLISIAEGRVDKAEPREVSCEQEGAIAVLAGIANELGIRDIVDQYAEKRRQGMSVGTYVLLAALNRAISAKSKTKIKEWCDQTAVHLHVEYKSSLIESQNFWDNFDKIGEAEVEQIGDAIAKRAVELENIDLDCLVYDTTNYYNYWDVTNDSELARMTKSKAGKNHLRHVGLALAVDRDHGLPLFHRLYPANNHDSKVFSALLKSMYDQIASVASDKKSLTLVFDKGNNSEEAIHSLDESRHHFVGSRSPHHHKDLCRKPIEDYRVIALTDGQSVRALETTEELYGQPRRIIVTYNESGYHRQLHRMERNIERAKEELSTFKRKAKGADGRSTIESIMRQGEEILARFHVTKLVTIDVEESDEGFKVSARKNFPAIEEAKMLLGKQVLFTNRESLTTAEVIDYYRDRNVVEEAFRITKSDDWVKWDPAFHWTDSKIRVHALTCVIALLLVRIAHKRARAAGFKQGAPRMMELLTEIRSAVLLYPHSIKPVRHLCTLTDEQRVLLTQLKCEIPQVR